MFWPDLITPKVVDLVICHRCRFAMNENKANSMGNGGSRFVVMWRCKSLNICAQYHITLQAARARILWLVVKSKTIQFFLIVQLYKITIRRTEEIDIKEAEKTRMVQTLELKTLAPTKRSRKVIDIQICIRGKKQSHKILETKNLVSIFLQRLNISIFNFISSITKIGNKNTNPSQIKYAS